MKPGDIIEGREGGRFEIVGDGPVAIMGQDGCTDVRCTRLNGKCVGYHCPKCGQPCSMMGHRACQEPAA